MEINIVQSNYRMLICSRHQPSISLSSLPPRFFLNRRRPIIHSSSQRLSSTAHFLLHRQFSEQRPRCAIHDGVTTNEPVANPSLMVKDKAARISPVLKGTSIFLVGINSAVKTNLGKALADALRYYYFDSDSLVEQAGGQESAGQSFRERDEKGFMDTETEVLRQLSAMGRLVVCAGDGAVQSSTNLAFLRYGISIWIDTPLDMVAREVLESPGGENSSSDTSKVLAKLRDQYERMRGGYGTADVTISVQKIAGKLGYDSMDAVTVEDLAIEILQEIERLTRAKRMMEDAARPF